MEHYRSEIEAVIEKGCGFGLFDGEIESCHECRSCGFSDSNNAFDGKHTCSSRRIGWLMSEYKPEPEPVLTQNERIFLEFIEDGWMARDENGGLSWYSEIPNKLDAWWVMADEFDDTMEIKGDVFSFITCEDKEPWSTEELKKLKVE